MTSVSAEERRRAEDALFARLHDPVISDAERSMVRDELIEMHLPLVRHVARRYADRGEPIDDVVQAGSIGLVQAVDRFDTQRGIAFGSYAVPTIVGAIRRHFRDATWTVKVPRKAQELRGQIDAAHDAIAQELGRSPTVAEIAERADVDAQDVLDSLEISHARTLRTLEAQNDDDVPLAERIGDTDAAITGVEDRQTVQRMLTTLPEREREIVTLRFFDGLSQSQIAEQVGVSQMHVSRLLHRSLQRLRGELGD
ncbi:MAG TPA: SigB/SigF/SigG family RNA polymerase sigma factor [Candidatus Nanopelagicales bacterium]|nr:SigB/SigF/SigG family RNA polymerase sigma factor [Candidatus Nanopelagicales bacterium]